MTLTNLQDRILRDKQRMTFNNMDYTLRADWKGVSNWYPDYTETEINKALSGLVELGLTDTACSMGSTELTLTAKGLKLACLMLS
tara:strand:+ start:110 stop:364 length:255 start_codon:yes stop_codon:yes gene_type:complete